MTTQNGKMSLEEELLNKYEGDIHKLVDALEKIRIDQNKRVRVEKPKKPLGDEVISVSSVTKRYKIGRQSVDALKNVSLQVRQGEYVALTGPSGSGKSTLLQLIGALDKPSDGVVAVDGQDISRLSDRKLSVFRNKTIGFVFQFFYLQPFLTLARNLEVPGMFARTNRKERRTQAETLAENVSLSDRLTHLPNELSGGQMQRAAIARALLNNPKIILADEPTGNLDRENAFAIMDLFDVIREKYGTTVIVVTHDAELASRADREIKLRDGEVVL